MRVSSLLPQYLKPHGQAHRQFDKVQRGELARSIDAESMGLDNLDLEEGDLQAMIKDLAHEEFTHMKRLHRDHQEYMELELMFFEDHWLIETFNTDHADNALDAMNNGLVWDRDEKKISLEQTRLLYSPAVERGRISHKQVEMLRMACKMEPSLSDLMAKVVYLKVSGESTQSEVVGKHDR